VPLDSLKKEKLQKTILSELGQAPLFKLDTKSKIPFFNRNIFALVRPLATERQLSEYQKYRSRRNWLVKKAYEKLDLQETL
jgi:hypothetical protein